MAEYYTNESAAHLLLSMTRIVEKPEDCEGLRKCLIDKRIDVGDYVKIDIGGGWYADGIVDHVPCKISDCWIIIEEDGLPRYCYDPPSLKLVRKGETPSIAQCELVGSHEC